jgi:hypothetical protein
VGTGAVPTCGPFAEANGAAKDGALAHRIALLGRAILKAAGQGIDFLAAADYSD